MRWLLDEVSVLLLVDFATMLKCWHAVLDAPWECFPVPTLLAVREDIVSDDAFPTFIPAFSRTGSPLRPKVRIKSVRV
ncbi:hypothetical protein N018_11440 [Pseudomonas syringae CC1557]|uniref:Uncharacterized protein n=1 Tax=Pseudomonas syringae CC1557 TaxID=1357279 RepID=W0N3D3_PSESX|nr:hypothetical protein N018_11440 [Pseudomonas syringae CC1557]